jgi:hypothetical protein
VAQPCEEPIPPQILAAAATAHRPGDRHADRLVVAGRDTTVWVHPVQQIRRHALHQIADPNDLMSSIEIPVELIEHRPTIRGGEQVPHRLHHELVALVEVSGVDTRLILLRAVPPAADHQTVGTSAGPTAIPRPIARG